MRFRKVGLLLCLEALMGQQAGYQGIRETLPLAVAPQPIPFSHRRHATARIQCADCHAKARGEERAGIPQAAQCMTCHVEVRKDAPAIRELARLAAAKEQIQWVRVYRLPDFVFFSHAVHGKAAVECRTCHGPVEEREVLQKEVSTGMRACVDCHRTRNAPTDCSRCHELGQ